MLIWFLSYPCSAEAISKVVYTGGTETYKFTTQSSTKYYIYIAYYGTSGSLTQTGTFSISRNCPQSPKSNDATLKNLTVNKGILTPAFNSNMTNYTVNVANSATNIQIGATTTNIKATAKGTGHRGLNSSIYHTTINIVVTAEDGITTKTYTIDVIRDEEAGVTMGKNDTSREKLNMENIKSMCNILSILATLSFGWARGGAIIVFIKS